MTASVSGLMILHQKVSISIFNHCASLNCSCWIDNLQLDWLWLVCWSVVQYVVWISDAADMVGRQFIGGQDARCFQTCRCRPRSTSCVRPAATSRAAVAGRSGSRSVRSAGTTGYLRRKATRRTTATARVRPDTGRRTTTPRSANSSGRRRPSAVCRSLGRRARRRGSAPWRSPTTSTVVELSASSTTWSSRSVDVRDPSMQSYSPSRVAASRFHCVPDVICAQYKHRRSQHKTLRENVSFSLRHPHWPLAYSKDSGLLVPVRPTLSIVKLKIEYNFLLSLHFSLNDVRKIVFQCAFYIVSIWHPCSKIYT